MRSSVALLIVLAHSALMVYSLLLKEPPPLLLLGGKRGFYLRVQELARRLSSQQHLARRTRHPPVPTGMTEKDSGTGLSPSLQPLHPNPA